MGGVNAYGRGMSWGIITTKGVVYEASRDHLIKQSTAFDPVFLNRTETNKNVAFIFGGYSGDDWIADFNDKVDNLKFEDKNTFLNLSIKTVMEDNVTFARIT